MTTEPFAAGVPRSPAATTAPWIGLGISLGLITLAMLVPFVTGLNVHIRYFPPIHAQWMPRVGPGTIAAIVFAGFAIRYASDLAARLRWGWLLLVAFGASLFWMLALATVDGLDGISTILEHQYEYLRTAREVTDFGAVLSRYIAHIPLDSVDNWPVHIAGHPPGALLFFVILVNIGLGSGLAAGLVVTVIAATTSVAVMATLRRLGAESAARKAAPLIALGPAAIWMSVSADAMFGAVAAWGLCLLAYAAMAKSWARTALWAAGAGLVLGYCVMMSYGLPLLGVLAVTVLLVARNWTPLPWAVVAAVAVVLAFVAGGFVWWDAYPVLVERYWDGIASRRPAWYWMWGNFAALSFSAGPLVGAAVAAAIQRLPSVRSAITAERVIVFLATAAFVTVLLADLSQMSKAEVERIWLPFVPWLLVGTALLSERWRRWGLVGQLTFAVVVQHLLLTSW
ncbi:hypothetical protein [Microbacterium sp. R86528]|uniref:hypothetical protein n=1 Tax=Microbacterium sp. R86528 TaxID=3093864 RepID=UPI0037C818A2